MENQKYTCYDCTKLTYKKETLLGIETGIPYCSVGVTNNMGDLHRKNGVCQVFKKKVK
jgi:hypothetical protein